MGKMEIFSVKMKKAKKQDFLIQTLKMKKICDENDNYELINKIINRNDERNKK